MTDEPTCPHCNVGVVPAGGVCCECGLPDPACCQCSPVESRAPAADNGRGMTLDEFRAWLGEPPQDVD